MNERGVRESRAEGRSDGGESLEITRVVDAPPGAVFGAWTEPERIRCWWGPAGFTSPAARTDPRVGGSYLFAMRSPDGQDFWSTGVYREVVRDELIVATDSFADAEGDVVPASHYGMRGDWPRELLVTVTFEPTDGRTRLTVRHKGFPDAGNRDLARAGWETSLDKLAACVGKTA
jgi:uncharacterized protein YndB with AHSA1/START domain